MPLRASLSVAWLTILVHFGEGLQAAHTATYNKKSKQQLSTEKPVNKYRI
jgi:hypothetical protein